MKGVSMAVIGPSRGSIAKEDHITLRAPAARDMVAAEMLQKMLSDGVDPHRALQDWQLSFGASRRSGYFD
jgi:hypothetical protein